MKKTAILFFILAMLHNIMGYYNLVNYSKELAWIAAIEKKQNIKFEILKIDINPYAYVYDSGFESVNKDVVVNKKVYHVFKNRIIKNVLYLYCVKKSDQSLLNKKLNKTIEEELFEKEETTNHPKKLLKSIHKNFLCNDDFISNLYHVVYIPKHDVGSVLIKKTNNGFAIAYFTPPDMV